MVPQGSLGHIDLCHIGVNGCASSLWVGIWAKRLALYYGWNKTQKSVSAVWNVMPSEQKQGHYNKFDNPNMTGKTEEEETYASFL